MRTVYRILLAAGIVALAGVAAVTVGPVLPFEQPYQDRSR